MSNSNYKSVLQKAAGKEALASAPAVWEWNFKKRVSETWETEYYFYAFSRKENLTLNVVVWVWLIKLMHKHSVCYSVFHFSVITCFINILLSHVWSYSFRLLMHHLMLTKPFLAVTSLMLFPAFSLPQSMICAFSQPHGCYDCDSGTQFFCPAPIRNHVMLSDLVTTCFSFFPQLVSPLS